MVSTRLKIVFSYDGTNYFGYAKQNNKVTIQEVIEKALSLIFQEQIKIYASGRTDKGVHAINQVADFLVSKRIFKKDLKLLKVRINKLINDDISIKKVEIVPLDFSSRFNAISKTYVYRLNNHEYNPLMRNYEAFENNKLNMKAMIEAGNLYLGEHSFKNFTSKENDENNFIRKVKNLKIYRKSGIIFFKFTGNGFMRYQIRKMVQVLIEIGKGNLSKTFIIKNLNSKERCIINYTAKPNGLYLKEVEYEK